MPVDNHTIISQNLREVAFPRIELDAADVISINQNPKFLWLIYMWKNTNFSFLGTECIKQETFIKLDQEITEFMKKADYRFDKIFNFARTECHT